MTLQVPPRHADPRRRRHDRPVRPAHHLFARLGHRPLRFPLRLLHGGVHDLSAAQGSAHARGDRPAVLAPSSPRACAKLRLTGGEPLVRKNIMWLIKSLSRHLGAGALDELTLTTNGSQLARYAERARGQRRRAASMSRSTRSMRRSSSAITRWGDFAQVMAGIDAAEPAGIKIKINTVALRGRERGRDRGVDALGAWREASTSR